MKIRKGDLVRYYFYPFGITKPQLGVVIDIYPSSVYKDKRRYAVERLDKDFIDDGYEEDFEVIRGKYAKILYKHKKEFMRN